jgi:hypothetical protein
MRDKPLGLLIFVVILGMIIGSVLGQIIGDILPESTPKTFLTGSYSPSFGFQNGALLLDLYVIKIKLGAQFTFNIISLIGMAVAVYLFRWYK